MKYKIHAITTAISFAQNFRSRGENQGSSSVNLITVKIREMTVAQISFFKVSFMVAASLFCGEVYASADHGQGRNLLGELDGELHLGGTGFFQGIAFHICHHGSGNGKGPQVGAYDL